MVNNDLNKTGHASKVLNEGPATSLTSCADNPAPKLQNCGKAPVIDGIQQWFNTQSGAPVSLSSLKGKVVLVDFWAEWCGPCRMFGPVYEKVSERHGDAVFGKVDTEAQPEVAATFKIASIPTLMIIRDNVVLFSQPGALPETALEELVTKAKELDMDEVRASLAASADA